MDRKKLQQIANLIKTSEGISLGAIVEQVKKITASNKAIKSEIEALMSIQKVIKEYYEGQPVEKHVENIHNEVSKQIKAIETKADAEKKLIQKNADSLVKQFKNKVEFLEKEIKRVADLKPEEVEKVVERVPESLMVEMLELRASVENISKDFDAKLEGVTLPEDTMIEIDGIKKKIKEGLGGSTARNLYQLLDVNLSGATDGQALVYNSTTGLWNPGDAGSTITGTDTQVLYFDGDDNPAGDDEFTWDKTNHTLNGGRRLTLNSDSGSSAYSTYMANGALSTKNWRTNYNAGALGQYQFQQSNADVLLFNFNGMRIPSSVVTTTYINFGATDGSTGYGFRNNNGTMQHKSSGGAWADFGGGVDWGDIGGTLANQTDLQSELDAKMENLVDDTTPTLGGNLDADGNDITNIDNIEIRGHSYAESLTVADTSIDWTDGNIQSHSITANTTFTFTDPDGPCTVMLKTKMGVAGSYTLTWPASVKWSGGTAPTPTTAGASVDVYSFLYDGTNYHGGFIGDFS